MRFPQSVRRPSSFFPSSLANWPLLSTSLMMAISETNLAVALQSRRTFS